MPDAPLEHAHQGRGLDLTSAPVSLRSMAADLRASVPLVMILARKDFYVRYRRASLGMFWAVGLPLVQTATLALVFSQVQTFQTPGVPYPVFVFSGMLPWTFFTATLSAGSTSVVDNAHLSSKIYFPRSVLPIVSAVSGLYGFAISLVLLVVMLLAYGVGIGPEVVALVPAVGLLVLLVLGFCLVISALHVYFRDFRYIVQAAVGAWFFITPVVYNLDSPTLSDTAVTVVRANPVTGVIELFRYSAFGSRGVDPGWTTSLAVSVATTVILLVAALLLHRRFDRVFSDLL